MSLLVLVCAVCKTLPSRSWVICCIGRAGSMTTGSNDLHTVLLLVVAATSMIFAMDQ